MTEYEQGYLKALEDVHKRINTYYGFLDKTQGASVQYFVKQICKELKEVLLNGR